MSWTWLVGRSWARQAPAPHRCSRQLSSPLPATPLPSKQPQTHSLLPVRRHRQPVPAAARSRHLARARSGQQQQQQRRRRQRGCAPSATTVGGNPFPLARAQPTAAPLLHRAAPRRLARLARRQPLFWTRHHLLLLLHLNRLARRAEPSCQCRVVVRGRAPRRRARQENLGFRGHSLPLALGRHLPLQRLAALGVVVGRAVVGVFGRGAAG